MEMKTKKEEQKDQDRERMREMQEEELWIGNSQACGIAVSDDRQTNAAITSMPESEYELV